jgi:uncharacterized repeat protein (TIGR01451 family)
VKVNDAPTSGAAVIFSDPDNLLRSNALDVTAGSQSFSYALPSSANNGDGTDNRGPWTVAIISTDDRSRLVSARFLVHDVNQSVADVTISKTLLDTTQVTAGNNTTYRVFVTNQGPDSASSVAFTDNTLPNTTFISFTQNSGPTFTCTPPTVGVAGSTECTRASMAVGDVAVFTAVYKLNTGVSNGAPLEDTIEIESATFDSHESSNSSTVDSEASNPTPPPCSLACPANISVGNDAGQAGAAVPFGAPTLTGTCGAVTSSTASGSFFQLGSSPVTFTEAGGQSCSFVVTVTDEEDPTISCPPNMTVDEKPAGSGSANVNFNVTATDNGGAATVNCTPDSGSSFNVGTTPVTCIATDQSGNTSECSFNVTVKEATCTFEQPLDIVEDADIDATGSQSCGTNVTFATPTATCPEPITSTVTCDHASGSFFPIGNTVVTCKSNPDGATTSFTVTVKDITAPVPNLSPLPTITGECSATAGVPTTVIIRDPFGNPIGTKVVNEPPTATDNCGGKIASYTAIDPITNQPERRTYDEPGTYTVHWLYTDASGNTSTQNQTVVVTGPNGGLSITGPPVVVVHNPVGSGSCTVLIDDVGALMNTTVSGTCGGFDITRTVSPAPAGDLYAVGATYTVVSTATDGALTASVTQQLKIVDDTQPTITAPPPVTVNADPVSCSVLKANVALGSPTAGAHCGVPTVTNNAPSSFPLGATTVTWTVTDTSGHTATSNQVVTVVDVTKPVITLSGANPLTWECHVPFVEPGATATDACDTSVPVNVSGTVNVNIVGTYTLTYNASDDSGNAAVARTRTVNVVDTTAPVVTLNGASSVTVECHTGYSDAGASATDSCSPTTSLSSTSDVNVNAPGTYHVVWKATDPSGNMGTATRTVVVVDTTPPVITTNGQTPSMWPPNHKYKTFNVTDFVTGVTDSCNTSLGLSSVVIEKVTSDEPDNGGGDGDTANDMVIAANCKSVQLRSERSGSGNGRVYTITFKATDASGNVGRKTAKVVVPHDNGNGGSAVDSGVQSTVNGSCP